MLVLFDAALYKDIMFNTLPSVAVDWAVEAATVIIKSPATVVDPTVVADSVEAPVVAPGVVMSTNTISRDSVSTFWCSSI